MPFQTTANLPPSDPKVTVVFSGLMVFRPGPNDTCEVGVHRFSTTHVTQVLLMVHRPNRPPIALPLLRGPLTGDFLIRLEPDPEPDAGDFVVFAPTPEPFIRTALTNDDLDYRWAVNLKEHHPTANINDGAKPLVKLKTGVLFTPRLTRPSLAPQLVRQDGVTVQLNRLAASMAVAINPADRTKVVLSWSDLGDPLERTLPREIDEDEPDTTYTVCFINDPPGLATVTHDEMSLYYKVIEDQNTNTPIHEDDRFILEYLDLPNSKTDEIPCLSTRLDP